MNVKTLVLRMFGLEESQIRNKGRRRGWALIAAGISVIIFAAAFHLTVGQIVSDYAHGLERLAVQDVTGLNEGPTVPNDNENVKHTTALLVHVCQGLKFSIRAVPVVIGLLGFSMIQMGLLHLRVYHILNAEQLKCGAVPTREE